MNAAQLKVLLDILGKADEHHDPAKPEVTHDLDGLAKQAGSAGIDFGEILAWLLKNRELVLGLIAIVGPMLAALIKKPAHQEPGATVPATPVAPVPATPAAPAVVVPDRLVLTLASVSAPGRTGAKTLKIDTNRLPQIVLVGSETSLDDGSILNFDAGVSARGVDLRVDLDPANTPAGQTNHPELLGKIKYIAEDAATGELLGSIGGPDASIRSATDYTDAKVDNGVAFVPNRWAESGGMAVSVKPKRKGGPVRIYAEIADVETIGSFVTPEIR